MIVPIRFGSGTRIKLLEAFADRIPAVSTSIGAEGLAVVDGTHLLLADDDERVRDGASGSCAISNYGTRSSTKPNSSISRSTNGVRSTHHVAQVVHQVTSHAAQPRA